MILAESPRRQRVTKLVNWGHWFALVNIAIAIIIASVFIFSSPLPDTALGTAYLFANWLGHISFMTFSGFVIFILPLCYLATKPNIIKACASGIAAIGLALLAFDALLYNRTGFHISFNSATLLKSEAQTQMNQFTLQDWGFLALLFIVWLGFQLILANAIWKRIARLQQHRIGAPVTSFFVLCFVSSHAIHVWADAQLYQPVIKQDNMFPLSYPATAKTTMSRYGLLDLARYEERKQLQFDPDIHKITYPIKPVYCSVESTKTTLMIVQTDSAPLDDLSQFNLTEMDNYYSTASSLEGLVMTTLFGVPEIYQDTLRTENPVLLALPVALETAVSIHTNAPLPNALLEGFRQPVTNTHDGLHIAFLPAAQISRMLNQDAFAKSNILIASGFQPDGGIARGRLLTNLDIQPGLASTEDLAPTILNALGCSAPVPYYSTGQNLLAPSRNWLVSTSGERIIVMHDNQRIEVLSNGSYEITDLQTQSRSTDNLNVDLLSRAIKHLTRFSSPQ
ncbi:DUF3413 domain-containing protein [Salinimonas sp. HHU 13199]|uniref:DUF3413 domain-containing protein n=1 Tax=Salinimonas profundi TaxID=2729140 RepID=A0ABR8LE26_9ALTE|nr:DUF3413 domain-containing protein [Salinimonas profundi]MBD3584551.1 DUF3413 domain-containing protein [Salinimonas profundi]